MPASSSAKVSAQNREMLAMSALKDQASYFYTPADAKKDQVEIGRAVRLGGMVEKGSIKRHADGVTIDFLVTDNVDTVPVRFTGIVPDLFKEGSGVVAEGSYEALMRSSADFRRLAGQATGASVERSDAGSTDTSPHY